MPARFTHKTRQTFGALHSSRNYRLYMIGQSISLTGTWMQTVAQAWLSHCSFFPFCCSLRSGGSWPIASRSGGCC